jgi:glycosyltransferase involved in cell wall biosynthesis
VIVESLSTGTPVVAMRSGGPPEIVDRPDVGRLATPGDVGSLARSICEVIDLAGDAATPGRCAVQARRWDWMETIGPMHERVYERAAAAK